jgi:hypothetical protein
MCGGAGQGAVQPPAQREIHRLDGEADLAGDPVDRVVGFNKMPGLDVYYAADGCYEDKAQTCARRCTGAGAATSTSPITSGRCLALSRKPKS